MNDDQRRPEVTIREIDGGAGAVFEAILRLLPSWFGIPEANDDYVRAAATSPGLIASLGDDDVGITTIVQHSPHAAEIHLMAVKPDAHRRGIGRAMLASPRPASSRPASSFSRSRRSARRTPTPATPRPERSGWRAASAHSSSSRRCGVETTPRCS